MVRGGIDDETIYAVLMNRDWKISDSILEKGGGAQRYALRQIERAKEDAIDPALRELNDRHAVIENFGGKCVVIEEVLDELLGRSCLTKQGFDHFRNRYMNRVVNLGPKKDKKGNVVGDIEMPVGEWWLRHPQRRQYNKIVFAPGHDVPGAYNLWRGFAVMPKPGECGLFLDHIRLIVCGGITEYYNYFVAWMANCVQNPDRQGQSAVILRGKQGCGKSIVPELFGELFGRHYLEIKQPEHLTGRFNYHLRDCVLLFADEAFFAGNKQDANTLKTIVTSRMLNIESKGVDSEVSANCIHLMMASNDEWVVNAEFSDRRNFVLDVLPDKIGDRAYFDAMIKQMREQGGKEALLHHLLTYDLKGSGIDIRDVPKTDALKDQKTLSMTGEAHLLYTILAGGQIPDKVSQSHQPDGSVWISTQSLADYALESKRKEWGRVSTTGLAFLLDGPQGSKGESKEEKRARLESAGQRNWFGYPKDRHWSKEANRYGAWMVVLPPRARMVADFLRYVGNVTFHDSESDWEGGMFQLPELPDYGEWQGVGSGHF